MVTKQRLYTINNHFISFLYASIIHKPVSFQFQNAYTCARLTNDANQQYNQVSSLFSLYCISTTLNKPSIAITFLQRQVFLPNTNNTP